MSAVPAPTDDRDERRDRKQRNPADVIRDLTRVRLPNPMGGGLNASAIKRRLASAYASRNRRLVSRGQRGGLSDSARGGSCA